MEQNWTFVKGKEDENHHHTSLPFCSLADNEIIEPMWPDRAAVAAAAASCCESDFSLSEAAGKLIIASCKCRERQSAGVCLKTICCDGKETTETLWIQECPRT